MPVDDDSPAEEDIRQLVSDIEGDGAQTCLSAWEGADSCYIQIYQTARISACQTLNPDRRRDYNCWEIAQAAAEVLGRCPRGGWSTTSILNLSINNPKFYD